MVVITILADNSIIWYYNIIYDTQAVENYKKKLVQNFQKKKVIILISLLVINYLLQLFVIKNMLYTAFSRVRK